MSKKEKIKGLLNRQTEESENRESPSKQQLFESGYVNTGIQENRNKEIQKNKKKKATFELDAELHTKLKIYSASEGKKMVEVVEEALIKHLGK